MNIKEEDFPLYQLLVKNNEPGVEYAIGDFEKACAGGDDEKFRFALGIQTCARDMRTGYPDHTIVRGNTKEMNDKTLQSCLSVFKDVATRGHQGGAMLVEHYEAVGITQEDSQPAKGASSFFRRFGPK